MALLLLFEKSDHLSYNELKATTKISDDHFPKHVQSLLEAKLLSCNTPVSYIIFRKKKKILCQITKSHRTTYLKKSFKLFG